MLLTGRRGSGAMSLSSLCLCLILIFTGTASAAVLGIDFGTLNIKAAIVKPGIPLDIVLTKDSKRKEVAAVAFKPNRDSKNNIVVGAGIFPERAYGGDALALQGRFPGEVFPNLKTLLGLQTSSEAEATALTYNERYPGLQLHRNEELSTTVFKSAAFTDDVQPFSVEELIGMQLANIRHNAEVMAGKGSAVEDAVIAIPPFYTAEEKRAIVKAANFAGLDVTALISDGLAVGLDYAKTRTFPEATKGEKPEYHLVFDMGAGSTSATVIRFQGKSVKDVGRFNKTIQEVTVLGAGWDRELGGDALNHVIMNDFIKKLLTKPVLKNRGTTETEVKKNGRAMARFFKEAERIRQILSANTEASASFEEILPEIDLRVKLTRAEFEKLTTEFAERVTSPITDALKMAKLEMKDLNSVILHGGAIRTPFVQAQLERIVDDKAKLRNNVNPDESAVFGAAFKAAGLSASFKVKEIRASDIAGYPASLTYVDKGKDRKQSLFSASAPAGAGATTKQVTFKDKDDFTFGFVQNVDGTDLPILSVKAENLTSSVQELTRRVGCNKDEMSTKFSIRLDATFGLPDIVVGGVSCESDEKSGSVGDSVKGWLGLGKKKDQEPLQNSEEDDGPVEQVDAATSAGAAFESEANSQSPSSSSDAAASSKSTEPGKKHLETIPLKWSISRQGNTHADAEQIKQIINRLKEFDLSDLARQQREEAQNVLESYTYFVRDFLEDKSYIVASTEEERALIGKTLQLTREWMESGHPSKAAKDMLKEKLDVLKELVEPVRTRRTESTQRPELVKQLQSGLDEVQKYMLKVESDAAKASSSIAKAATGSSSTNVGEASSTADFDNSDSPETTEVVPSSRETVATNPYDSLDISTIQEKYDSISKWLQEKLPEQEKLQPYENALLTTEELSKRADDVKQALQDFKFHVNRITKPTPKSNKASKAKSTKKAKPTAADVEEPSSAPKPDADANGDENDASNPELNEDLSKEDYAEMLEKLNKGGEKFGKPVQGGETIDDMLKWMDRGKKNKEGHGEL